MKQQGKIERLARYLASYFVVVIVYLLLIPFMLFSGICMLIGQTFNAISKCTQVNIEFLNDLSFEIIHGYTRKEFERKMKEEIDMVQRMASMK